MLPYQPNSDALLPPPALPSLPAELFSLVPLVGADPVFAKAFFFSFFSDFSLAFSEAGFVFGDGLGEASTTNAFLGLGFGIGFGVPLGFGGWVAAGFGVDVDVGVDFGVGEGNSISLSAVVATGFSSSASPSCDGPGSTGRVACLGGSDASFVHPPAAESSALPSQTMLSGFDDALAARLQRISPTISTKWARAIKVTFRQKRQFFGIVILTTNGHQLTRTYTAIGWASVDGDS
jgi:hypothetical protein